MVYMDGAESLYMLCMETDRIARAIWRVLYFGSGIGWGREGVIMVGIFGICSDFDFGGVVYEEWRCGEGEGEEMR